MSQTFHRRNLPHLYDNEGIYFITYCLADSFQVSLINNIYCHEYNSMNEFKMHFQKYDSLLDSFNSGNNYLAKKGVADICKMTLLYPDDKEYRLI